MDQVDTLHVGTYWSDVLFCTIMTHLGDLEVKVMDLERPRCRNHRNRPCKTREKSKSIITMFVDVNYTFKHSSFRNRLNFQAASIDMHVVCPRSYLG